MVSGRRARSTVAVRVAAIAVVLVAAACTGPPTDRGTPTGTPTGTAVATVEPTEPAPSPRTEDPDQVEPGAGGSAGIAVEIVGLPVGGGATFDEAGTWCQVLAWGESGASGTVVEVHTVRTSTAGAVLRDVGCQGAPPCVGAVLVDGAGSCAVVVTPPTPDVDHVLVALDATVRCTVRTACDAVRGTDGWWPVANPVPASGATQESDDPADDPSDDPAGGTPDGTLDDAPDQVTDPAATP